MARPMWKGSISFGLVNIPVSLFNGEQTAEMHFNLLDRRDQAHIRYKKINELTGKEVKADDIVKGFKLENDQYIILEDSDFEHIAAEASKTVEITDFVKREEIDPRYFDRPYYLVPEKTAKKATCCCAKRSRNKSAWGSPRSSCERAKTWPPYGPKATRCS